MQGLTAASSRRRLASGALPLSKGDSAEARLQQVSEQAEQRDKREGTHRGESPGPCVALRSPLSQRRA